MNRIEIIYVGKLHNDYRSIVEHYRKLIKYDLKFTEITYSKKIPSKDIKNFESNLINGLLEKKSYKIVLNIIGKSYSSPNFTKLLQNIFQQDRNIQFVIGGAFGFDESVSHQADINLSLSDMTMPHQMVKIILLEQIYRAQTITTNHPYHKY